MNHPILGRVLSAEPPPFALLHRPDSSGRDRIDLITGRIEQAERIADIPLSDARQAGRHQALAILPYRQIGERGYAYPDDSTPLLVLAVEDQAVLPVGEVLGLLPEIPAELENEGFETTDEEYAALVRRVIDDEIGRGAGANFVVKRSFTADITNWSSRTALSLYRRLLARNSGSYWTFVIHTGKRTLIGTSPERHVSLAGGNAVMNPISGTYRYPPGGPDHDEVLEFLSNPKEANELWMVLDEELKMMGRVCDLGGRVIGPGLKQMSRLAHTEYLIEGRTSLDALSILRETLFAPTVTGGPLESACEVISRYEPEGRGYYAGVAALIGHDALGAPAMDSTILIRTADVDVSGAIRIPVGATLVRDSDPDSEAEETKTKAAGLLDALRSSATGSADRPDPVVDLNAHSPINRALARKNAPLADFWFDPPEERANHASRLRGRKLLIIDAEDTFTSMMGHMLTALGCEVTIRRFDEEHRLAEHDLVVIGPGPGDPRNLAHPKIARLRETVFQLLRSGTPFLAVCLGHQVLGAALGLELIRKAMPHQGLQRRVDIFGSRELAGFYNTFSVVCATDRFDCPIRGGTVQVFRDKTDHEIHALRGPGYSSIQFHPESVLTQNGVRILHDVIDGTLSERRAGVHGIAQSV